MRVIIRDITVNKYKTLILPMEKIDLKPHLQDNHEYIIIDTDCTLNPGQYDSITELNDFLIECLENSISEDDLYILSRCCLYHEVMEMVREESYTIVDFESETENWSYSDFTSESDKGRVLYDCGYYQMPFEVTTEMEDWIDWSIAWRNASCSGWREVRVGDNEYLVHC